MILVKYSLQIIKTDLREIEDTRASSIHDDVGFFKECVQDEIYRHFQATCKTRNRLWIQKDKVVIDSVTLK